ncbi:MAG: threonylcarbamoyl-AMP synthase [Bacteroidales bacterium]|nr:threonylcarbamoyl-AMP synthase [Bacteroidales bacterium]
MTEEIQKTVEVLRNGGIILYPTDTVWGIGCDATNPDAVAKVYAIKHRSDSKSLVLLASDMDMICRFVAEIPEMAVQLVEVNDRPMTIIYPGAKAGAKAEGKGDIHFLAPNAVAEDLTVGIRIPMNDFCVEVCRRLGRPIVSTSANISGEPTPKNFAEITDAIKDAVDYTVDPSLEKGSTGLASQIIMVGLDSSIKIIRA